MCGVRHGTWPGSDQGPDSPAIGELAFIAFLDLLLEDEEGKSSSVVAGVC